MQYINPGIFTLSKHGFNFPLEYIKVVVVKIVP